MAEPGKRQFDTLWKLVDAGHHKLGVVTRFYSLLDTEPGQTGKASLLWSRAALQVSRGQD